MPAKILVVDDDLNVLKAVTSLLKRDGHTVLTLSDPVEGLTVARDPTIDVVVSDITMPNLTGLELLKAFKQVRPDIEFIIMTGNASVETAMEAVRAGAFDYLAKPFERIEDFSLTVQRAVERRGLLQRTAQLERQLAPKATYGGVLGRSAQMSAVMKQLDAVSDSAATVLIRGESGTGKELIAKALHFSSPRKDKPFVTVNCSALTETLLESELFGHVKGAFTGALATKQGLFEAANGGSLFLDEIGDVSAATQVRLLRVLQENEIKRVGGTDTIKVDVRVIAATNVDLERARDEGKFRDDLYYRLNVVTLTLPPLRDRPDDVAVLAQHFLEAAARRARKTVKGFTPAALGQLVTYAWPGNVRELENAIERAVVFAPGENVDLADLPPQVREATMAPGSEAEFSSLAHLPFAQAKALTVAAFEKRYLSTLLHRSRNNITVAALAAGTDRTNFRRLMKAHGLRRATDDKDSANDEGDLAPSA